MFFTLLHILNQPTMNNSQKWIYILLICLLAVAICNAQDKQTKTDTASIVKQAQAEYKAAVERFDPIWVLLTTKGKKLSYVAGFQRGDGVLVDANKAPLANPELIIFAIAPRKDKGKAVYNKEGK